MTKTLFDYISTAQRCYEYRLKTIHELSNEQMDVIERYLLRHDPKDVSMPKRLMLQSKPVDFPHVQAAEIYVVDFVLNLPVSPYTVHKELCKLLHFYPDDLVVRGVNDPVEIEAGAVAAKGEMDCDAHCAGEKQASILTDPNYEDTEPHGQEIAGNEYNSKLLAAMMAVQKENPTQKKVGDHPMSVWKEPVADVQPDNGAFNADIKDAPKHPTAGEGPVNSASAAGNLTDHKRTYKRKFGKDGEYTMRSKEVK